MLIAKTSEGTKTDENGNFVYYQDNKVYYDAKGSDTQLLGKTVEDIDAFKYFFYIEKNSDGTLKIRAWNTELYWPSVEAPTAVPINYHPGQKTAFTLSNSATNFTTSKNGQWCTLSFPGKYIYFNWGVKTGDCTDFVVLNDNQQVGYYDSSTGANALVQFYAVSDVPEADQLVTFTYNYTFNGTSRKKSAERTGVIGRDYPEANDVLPDYVIANKPSGKVKAEDNGQSIEVVCTEELPFKTSTDANPIYYYLENVQGTRLYSDGGLQYRTVAQAKYINDIKNDLWYVTGNPFDGFQFHNVATGHVAKTNATITAASLCWLTIDSNGSKDTWYIYKITNQAFGIHAYSIANEDFAWNLVSSKNRIKFEHPGTGDAFAFRLVEPTFTFPMYPVGQNTYNSFAAPFDVEVADDNIKMYKGTLDAGKRELLLDEVNAAPANSGVVLIGENSNVEMVTLKAVAGVQPLESNSLVGTTSEIPASDLTDKLIFGVAEGTDDEVGFFLATSSVTALNANHAYLDRATAQVKGISMRFDGQPTCIGHINSGKDHDSDSPIYDLTGRRALRTEKGELYIQNGRKFIVK